MVKPRFRRIETLEGIRSLGFGQAHERRRGEAGANVGTRRPQEVQPQGRINLPEGMATSFRRDWIRARGESLEVESLSFCFCCGVPERGQRRGERQAGAVRSRGGATLV
jgi:hypothetical protein